MRKYKFSKRDRERSDGIKNELFKLVTSNKSKTDNLIQRRITLDDLADHKDSLTVALANFKMSKETFTDEYLRRPKISDYRKQEINKIFNLAEKEKAEMLVLPEASMPVRWLKWVTEEAKRKKRAMVFGMEHWIVNDFACNFIVTLLPVKLKNFDAVIVLIRLKNHYSPYEEQKLKEFHFKIPKPTKSSYDYICWRNNYFTVFNCFELANITHRASFRSKVDFVVACELNPDTEYFSNIVESSCRDIHCYFVQCNDAKFGDSRITQPKKSYDKDIVNIKGGDNSAVLLGKIDIKALRDFQLKKYELQKRSQDELDTFKPTPPDFDTDEVKKRKRGTKI